MAKVIGQHIPTELKNIAVNGGMDFWQRVEANTTSFNTATGQQFYTADMIKTTTQGTTVKNFSVAQSSNVPTQAQSGYNSNFSHQFTQVGAIASAAATDATAPWSYWMEGYDYEKIHNKLVTFGFWINCSVPGTYAFSMQNTSGTRNYATTFTVSAASTWQYVPLSIQLDSAAGNWTFNNTASLIIYIGIYGGSNFTAATTNAWTSTTNQILPSGLTNWQATAGATINVTQFSIVEGPLGFSSTGFTRRGANFQQELALCQRYYEKSYDIGTVPGTGSNTAGMFGITGATVIQNYAAGVKFATAKRLNGYTWAYWDIAGNPSKVSNISGAGAATNNVVNSGAGGSSFGTSGAFFLVAPQTTPGGSTVFHWSADAGL